MYLHIWYISKLTIFSIFTTKITANFFTMVIFLFSRKKSDLRGSDLYVVCYPYITVLFLAYLESDEKKNMLYHSFFVTAYDLKISLNMFLTMSVIFFCIRLPKS